MRVGDRFEENAVWTYETPYDEGEEYIAYLALYWDRMDKWMADDNEIVEQPPER